MGISWLVGRSHRLMIKQTKIESELWTLVALFQLLTTVLIQKTENKKLIQQTVVANHTQLKRGRYHKLIYSKSIMKLSLIFIKKRKNKHRAVMSAGSLSKWLQNCSRNEYIWKRAIQSLNVIAVCCSKNIMRNVVEAVVFK